MAVSAAVKAGLKEKVENHNADVGNVASKRTNLRTLTAVFERGVGAYNTNPGSVRPSVSSPEQWAYARVNSFLYCLRNGRFRSGQHDTDLLPKGHPKSTKSATKIPPNWVEDPPCRIEGELLEECISRKISSLMAENPEWEDDQAYAVASEMCSSYCEVN